VTSKPPRSRVVVFRLTEQEFAQLKKAAARSGRSLSDYTRTGVLSTVKFDHERSANDTRAQVSELQTILQEMKELIRCVLSTNRQIAG
jgi:hypothetical protein